VVIRAIQMVDAMRSSVSAGPEAAQTGQIASRDHEIVASPI